MLKTITENGYNLESTNFLISVTKETSFGKTRRQYYVENKETNEFWFPKTLAEAKNLVKK